MEGAEATGSISTISKRFCEHCAENVSKSMYYRHKRLFCCNKETGQWSSSSSVSCAVDQSNSFCTSEHSLQHDYVYDIEDNEQ